MDVVILSAQRTAVGSFQGRIGSVSAPQLGATAIRAAITQAQLDPKDVSECIMGQVLSAGSGQAPARQAAIAGGLPVSVPCMTINKVCGSGLKAVMLAADSIQVGNSEVVVAGGQENMTLSPHLLEKSRFGYKMGHVQMYDSMIRDGLWDPYKNYHMGNAAEICVREHQVTRAMQDEFAIRSYENAQKAQKAGAFKNEICAVEVRDGKEVSTFSEDEEPTKARFDKMPTLRPAFDKDGTITAANASKINDGAAALVLASMQKAKALNKTPLARIVAHSTFAQEPEWFTTAPNGAIKAVLKKANLTPSQIDLWEINEAFSVVTMMSMKAFEIPRDKVNVNGGAVSLGHPIGASGARILTTLCYALQNNQKRYGLATLCIGGGEGVAMIVERV